MDEEQNEEKRKEELVVANDSQQRVSLSPMCSIVYVEDLFSLNNKTIGSTEVCTKYS